MNATIESFTYFHASCWTALVRVAGVRYEVDARHWWIDVAVAKTEPHPERGTAELAMAAIAAAKREAAAFASEPLALVA